LSKKTIRDTFFLNPKQALKIAKRQNKLTITNKPHKYAISIMEQDTQKRQVFYNDLQICFYSGEKIQEENIPENCIHVPLNKAYDFFKESRLRYPEIVNFKGIKIEEEGKKEIIQLFRKAINNANIYKNNLAHKYVEIAKKNKPDFNEPLRIYAMSNRHSTAVYNVLNNLTNAFKKSNYDALLSAENNSMESVDQCWHIKAFADFNPHVVISINHLNHDFLNDSIYNVVWCQDFVPQILEPDIEFKYRKRDIILSLFKDIDILLNNKNIKYYRQSFCASEDVYYEDKTIKRENKIVFIGHRSNDWLDMVPKKLVEEVEDFFEKSKTLSKERATKIAKKYDLSPFYIYSTVFPIIMRELAVKWMCKVSPIPVEVYGDEKWNTDPDIKKHLVKKLSYGKEIRDIYNSAKYVLVSQPKYLKNQRLFEGVASGCIPIVYDCRPYEDPPHHEDEILYFKSKKELKKILEKKKEPKNNPRNILDGNRYEDMVQKLIFIITKRLRQDNC